MKTAEEFYVLMDSMVGNDEENKLDGIVTDTDVFNLLMSATPYVIRSNVDPEYYTQFMGDVEGLVRNYLSSRGRTAPPKVEAGTPEFSESKIPGNSTAAAYLTKLIK